MLHRNIRFLSDLSTTMSLSEKTQRRLNPIDYAIAGGTSGAICTCICQPVDVIKIRFQLQIEPIRKGVPDAKYMGMVHACHKIIREEGVTALWKGHIPAQLLSILYGVCQFTSFEIMVKSTPGEYHQLPFVQFACGAASGIYSTVVSFPFDVMRTRLVAQGEPKVYSGITQAAKRIYIIEGPRAFFKGLSPTLIQVAPHTGAQFASYAFIKDIYRKLVGDDTEATTSALKPLSLSGSLICGSLSGIFAKALVYPFDLMRKRLQVQGFEEAREKFGKVLRCSGLIDCFRKTLEEEKIWGLYKGLIPSLLKPSFTTAINFCIYEQICILLAKWHS